MMDAARTGRILTNESLKGKYIFIKIIYKVKYKRTAKSRENISPTVPKEGNKLIDNMRNKENCIADKIEV